MTTKHLFETIPGEDGKLWLSCLWCGLRWNPSAAGADLIDCTQGQEPPSAEAVKQILSEASVAGIEDFGIPTAEIEAATAIAPPEPPAAAEGYIPIPPSYCSFCHKPFSAGTLEHDSAGRQICTDCKERLV